MALILVIYLCNIGDKVDKREYAAEFESNSQNFFIGDVTSS